MYLKYIHECQSFKMSVLVSTSCGFVISHQEFIRQVYNRVECEGSVSAIEYKPEMFTINTPFKTNLKALKDATSENRDKSARIRRRQRPSGSSNDVAQRVQNQAKSLIKIAQERGFLSSSVSCGVVGDNNSSARSFSSEVLRSLSKAQLPPTFHGANATPKARFEPFGNEQFLFPHDCRFFCNNVLEMEDKVDELGKFDLIVIDPPWWNKYIRRKRAHDDNDGYKMLSTDDLMKIPVAQLLNPGAMVAVWCTNSEKHLYDLQNCLMPSWGIKHIASWCWLKATNSGEPVCAYSPPPGKQPYEQLVFGVETLDRTNKFNLQNPEDGLLVVSVPSAIHSHKPPLLELLKNFVPPKAKCLEIFARSLLPECTSWGLEVLKLQHESLFNKKPIVSDTPCPERGIL